MMKKYVNGMIIQNVRGGSWTKVNLEAGMTEAEIEFHRMVFLENA